jgi:hypothetical protein
MKQFWHTFDIGRLRFGVQHDIVAVADDKYLERWILWLGVTIRIHKFYRGDQDRALHDHPWPFITFPLHTYAEHYWDGEKVAHRPVKRFRFHYRPATHRHIVRKLTKGPTWTIVFTGWKVNEWGFWPENDKFVHWREWDLLQKGDTSDGN